MAHASKRRLGIYAVVATLGILLAACGGSSGSGTSSGSGSMGSKGQVATQAVKNYTQGLPPNIAKLYTHAVDLLGPSAYRKWKPTKPPWTVCFQNSYLGNSWRATTLKAWNEMVSKYEAAGLVKTAYVTNSNLSIPSAISQFTDMITADRCSAILTIPNGTSGLDSVIKRSYDKGIPVVVDQGPQTTPYGENYDENFYELGAAYLNYFAKVLHGQVNMLDVIGIPGETLSVDYQTALKAFLMTHPNFHVVGTVTGQVTDSVAKQAVLQFLSTHPGKIDAVYQEGGMASGILQAFQQANRPVPAMGDVGAGGFLAVWHQLLQKGQHPDFIGLAEPPGASMREAFRVMIMLLEGQHPKNITIYFTPPQITAQNLNSWWNPSLTVSSTNYPEPPGIMPMKDLFPYFSNPAPTMPYAGKGQSGQG